jgi:hypothetical protein
MPFDLQDTVRQSESLAVPGAQRDGTAFIVYRGDRAVCCVVPAVLAAGV